MHRARSTPTLPENFATVEPDRPRQVDHRQGKHETAGLEASKMKLLTASTLSFIADHSVGLQCCKAKL